MSVEWSASPSFDRITRVAGPFVGADTDYVGKTALAGLPSGTKIYYRAKFHPPDRTDESLDATEDGSFGTAPTDLRDVVLAWSGDTNGQGFGIDPAQGGMPAYAALAARKPDLFVHCGDSIYADNPIPKAIALSGGRVWNNLVDPSKSHVAETLDDFRGAHLYPRRCEQVRLLSATVPLFSIWDDHEVHNNWFPGQVLDDPSYTERRVDVLAVPALRAFYEYTPTLRDPGGPMYRVVSWGPLLDVFLLDGRSFRTPNEPAPPEGHFLGDEQASWLLDALTKSTAAWKVVACDMPIGVVIAERGKAVPQANDGWANRSGPPVEREVELAKLLSALRARKVKNVVWVTADVHYCATHKFDPERAAFKDFDPFWELVAGPMHALTLSRKPTDDTFGCEVVWSSADWKTWTTPADGTQHFGLLRIDARTRAMTVTFVDARGRDLHTMTLTPS
jgi:alkaline phosphatase D